MTAPTYMALRFSIAAVLFISIMAVTGFPRIDRRAHVMIALTALAEPVFYFLFESYGLQLTTASKASLIIATIPVMVLVAAHFFLHERMTRRGVLSVFISLAGISLVVLGDRSASLAQPSTIVGDLLVFGAVVSAATYITLARHLTQTYAAIHITGLQITYGAVVFSLLWVFQPSSLRIPSIDAAGWGALIFLVLGATIGAFLLYNHSLSRVTAGKAALFINAIPVITAVTARIVLQERLTSIQIFGGILVIAAVVWSESAGKSENVIPPVEV